MSELSSWLQQNRPMILESMNKYINRLILFIDYVPIVGPVYNATYALNLLVLFWYGSSSSSSNQSGDGNQDDLHDRLIRRDKSRQIREKGLAAIVTALVDIFTICLAVGVIAFICDCLVRIQTFAIVRTVLILFILINVLALTVGAKIIAGQLIIHLTRQLEDVNMVGTSMVKSVTITASAIERIVETTESTTNIFVIYCRNCWYSFYQWLIALITWPKRSAILARRRFTMATRRLVWHTKLELRRRLTVGSMLNAMTLGVSGRFLGIGNEIKED